MKLTDLTNTLGITNTKATNQQKTKEADTQDTPQEKKQKEPKKIIMTWEAISRPLNKQMSPKAIKTLIIIGAIVGLLLAAMQQFFLILGILSLIFVSYMLSQVPGEPVKYEITNLGIGYADMFYEWDQIKHFFFFGGTDVDIIAVDILDNMPARIFLTLPENKMAEVKAILEEHTTFLAEEPKSFIDKTYEAVISKINLDRS